MVRALHVHQRVLDADVHGDPAGAALEDGLLRDEMLEGGLPDRDRVVRLDEQQVQHGAVQVHLVPDDRQVDGPSDRGELDDLQLFWRVGDSVLERNAALQRPSDNVEVELAVLLGRHVDGAAFNSQV